MRGLDILGADDSGPAAVVLQKGLQKQADKPKAAPPSDGGTSWAMIGGIVLTVIVAAIAVPKILAD